MSNIKENILNLRTQINSCLHAQQKPIDSVTLLAVSKGHTCDEILEAAQVGQLNFGESYLQEALEKINTLSSGLALTQNEIQTQFPPQLNWHFIGRIQSKKIKIIAQNFSWVHSVYSLDIATFLNEHRPSHLPPLNVCLQVNLNDVNKAGLALTEVENLAQKILQQMPKLKLRGLMTIPAINHNSEEQFKVFCQLTNKYEELNTKGYHLDTLSMGMSDDYLTAIAAGSNLVRIGTAIFGPRR